MVPVCQIGVLTVIRAVSKNSDRKQAFSIEEPRNKLRGMFCRAAVLRIDRKEFCLI
jgi:hypothetical protein